MRLLSRSIFREIAVAAILGISLFTLVLFLQHFGSNLVKTLVGSAAPARTVGMMMLLAMPYAIPFTMPLGVLVGVLIGLSRMSSDGEITALRSAGVSGRAVASPAIAFACVAMLGTAAASIWIKPWSIRETNRRLTQIAAAQLTAEVTPRVFEEKFQEPKVVLYVDDVTPLGESVARWRNLFIADMTPPENRPDAAQAGEGPRVTLAQAAIARPDASLSRIQLTLVNGASYEVERDIGKYKMSQFPSGDQILEAEKPGEYRSGHPEREMPMAELFKLCYQTPGVAKGLLTESRIEFHQRLSLPLACVLLALVGIPIGVSSRRSAKSAAFVLTVALAFVYYMVLMGMMNLARQGRLPVEIAMWIPNLIFAVIGTILMVRLENPQGPERFNLLRNFATGAAGFFRRASDFAPSFRLPRVILLPQLLDTYVLTAFFFWFLVLLASFVLISHIYTFFVDILNDVIRNQIPMRRVLTYLFFLTPKYVYDFAPISVLAAVLVTFGILAKNNEVTALKACGVSLYRIAAPAVIAAIFLSAGLFAFDHFYIPEANRIQDGIRSEIKGRPAQTYQRPDRKWVHGQRSRIFYYKFFDPKETAMLGVSVFDLDADPFRLRRHISAEKARWEPSIQSWVFQNGWYRELEGLKEKRFDNFTGQARTFSDLAEKPDYFLIEVKQGKQMNFVELDRYIGDLNKSGFDTIQLQVQFHRKFAVPLFAVIMALLATPFAFSTGGRGAMAAAGTSFALAIGYLAVNLLFEQVGNLSLLPPLFAAWAPGAFFALTGMYFIARLRT